MTVESNHAIAVATLGDWFKSLVPAYQPMKRKAKTNHDLHAWYFQHFEQVTWNCYESGLVHCAVEFAPTVNGPSNYFWYLFYDSQLKTAVICYDCRLLLRCNYIVM